MYLIYMRAISNTKSNGVSIEGVTFHTIESFCIALHPLYTWNSYSWNVNKRHVKQLIPPQFNSLFGWGEWGIAGLQ